MGYLAAKTERIQIGSGIVNVYSRTPALMAMTFAGLDYVSDGRVICGLGASGPQVIEGFHGVPYEKPMQRIKEYIEVCRMVWRREVLTYDGQTVQIPLPEGQGTGLGRPLKLINHPVRADIPIWWASLMGLSVAATAELADGWLPVMFIPERADRVWGDDLRKPAWPSARPTCAPLEISRRRHRRHRRGPRRGRRPTASATWPAPARRCTSAAWAPAARTSTTTSPAATASWTRPSRSRTSTSTARRTRRRPRCRPSGWRSRSLVGPRSYVAERVAAYKEAGVTVLSVSASGPDAVKTVEQLRSIVDDA